MACFRSPFTHAAFTMLVSLYIAVSPAFAQLTSPATTPRPGPGYTLECISCSSYIGNSPNPDCTASGVNVGDFATIEDCEGPCTTSQDSINQSVVTRGCITSYHLDPFDVAPEGCYTYQGSTVCVCYIGFCNMGQIGVSSGAPLLVNTSVSTTPAAPNTGSTSTSTLTTAATSSTAVETTATTPFTAAASSNQITSTTTPTTATTTTTTTAPIRTTSRDTATTNRPGPGYILDCISCSSYIGNSPNPDCTASGVEISESLTIEECEGPCTIRRDPVDPTVITRGCITSYRLHPSDVASEGCYTYQGSTMCVCYSGFCNLDAIGVSSGKPLLLNQSVSTTSSPVDTSSLRPETTTTTTTTTTKPIIAESVTVTDTTSSAVSAYTLNCVSCTNYFGNSLNRECSESRVTFGLTLGVVECQGPCTTRRDPQDPKVITRGCVTWYDLDPHDITSEGGCYDWQGSTMCVCYTSFCNTEAIDNSSGKPLLMNETIPTTTAGTSIKLETSSEMSTTDSPANETNVTAPDNETTTNSPVGNATEISDGSFRNDFRCGETAIEVFIPAYLVPNSQLTLRDESCKLVNNGTHHVISFPYNQCGTSEIFYSQQILITNEIKVQSTLKYVDSGPVKFVTDYTIPLNCFPGGNQTVSSVLQILAPEKFQEGVLPNARFEIREYKSANYQEQITAYPVKVPLNREIYFELALTNALPNTSSSIQVSKCQATPSDNPNDRTNYLLVSNGCSASPAVQILARPTPDLFRFSSQAFQFSNANDLIYVHCYVSVCSSGQCTLPCGRPGRGRRSLRGRLQSDLVTLTSSGFQVVTE